MTMPRLREPGDDDEPLVDDDPSFDSPEIPDIPFSPTGMSRGPFLPPADDFSPFDDMARVRHRPDAAAEVSPEPSPKLSDCPRIRSGHEFALTDVGNAEHFAAMFGDGWRFDHRRQHWLHWEEHRFCPDEDGRIRLAAKEAMQARLEEAVRLVDPDQQNKAVRHALSSQSRAKQDAFLTLAKSEPPLADRGDAWDCDPFLLGVPNGVVDLRTGLLRPGRREDRITKTAGVPFDPTASSPLWVRFLEDAFSRDVELIDYVQRAVGYTLTGDTSEQVVFFCHGPGANGKGTMFRALARVFGDYAYNMPFSTVEFQTRTGIPNDLAALGGRRFVTASETNDGTRLNEARIKALTGCDPITARFLHAEFFTFQPVAKFWLAMNHRPIVRDDSYAFWRRIRLIPFLQTFKVNRAFEPELLADAPGILAWAVRGCLRWQREGLCPPASVVQATDTYQVDSDVLQAFLDAACELVPTAELRAAEFYAHYRLWADREGLTERERLTSAAFGRKVKERFEYRRDSSGFIYIGVARLP